MHCSMERSISAGGTTNASGQTTTMASAATTNSKDGE